MRRFASYGGYEYELESGLYHIVYRYYDPEIGRFLSLDPEGFGVNWYVYSLNDPINLFDWFGLEPEEIGGLIIGPKENPWLVFTWEGTWEGLKTGLAAVGSSFTFGIWSGGEYKGKTGFQESLMLANLGRDLLLAAAIDWISGPTKIWYAKESGLGVEKGFKFPWTKRGANFRIGFHRLPNRPSLGKHAGKYRLHYHRRGPGGIGRHRPYESGPGGKWSVIIMWDELLEDAEKYRRRQTICN